jgi:Tol biopolymer transport system component
MTVSDGGDLAYVNGRVQNTRLTWLDRSGRSQGVVPMPQGRYEQVTISPDGRMAAAVRAQTQAEADIWLVDLERQVSTRFTFGPARNDTPIWSPDGRRIVFESNRDGPSNFFAKPVDGSSPESTLYASDVPIKNPTLWSHDGRWITFEQLDPKSGWDVYVLPADGSGPPKPYLNSPFNERFGMISPDGRWIAYTSDESGQPEVYAQSFPIPGNKYRVSTAGGQVSLWRADGRELDFLSLDLLTLYSCDVSTATSFHASAPRTLFRLPVGSQLWWPTPDFQRILVPLQAGDSEPATITVVLDWAAGLKKP